jgi:hypothetical protein
VTPHECPREADVAAAIRLRVWRADDDDLRAHVEQCVACAEVAAVCEALSDDRDALRGGFGPGNGSLPSAGQVWHRATLRARAEGLQSASRSLVWAYGIAGAAVVGLIAAFIGAFWPMVTSTLRLMAWTAPAPVVADGVSGWLSVARQHGVLLAVAVGVCLALAPLAVYFAIRDDQKL